MVFIKEHWSEAVYTIILGIIGWTVKRLASKVKNELTRQSTVQAGVLAILHDRLYQACQHHLDCGYCSVADAKNLEMLYTAYKTLGGNGVCAEMFGRCVDLPYNERRY